MAVLSPITVARFWSKVAVTPDDRECWLWKGAINGNGYGNFRAREMGRTTLSAHRVAYALGSEAWPEDGLIVRHDCDTPLCQNPRHLRLGTKADNSQDMKDRGRSHLCGRAMAGNANPAAKLNTAKVEEIQALIAAGKTNTAIAQIYGVKHSTISNIRRGKGWGLSSAILPAPHPLMRRA